MNTLDGLAISSWESGQGDLVLAPDLSTLRMVPWHRATAQCDVRFHDGSPVGVSPRQILRRLLDRLAAPGCEPYVGTELEFMVFPVTDEQVWERACHGLTPVNRHDVGYSVLGTGRIDPPLRRLRDRMAGAGMVVESAKGECSQGQHEIAFSAARP